jgi:hypothetical protein
MLPTLRQGRLVVWDGITRDGNKVLDMWHPDLIAHRRNDEMKLELVNGSVWQVVGSDNYNSLVGSNPVGVVFSEYSIADPAAWDFIRPILAENGGWALFIYTPRGRNHGYDLFQAAEREEDWFCQRLTRDDTDAISVDAVEAERRAGMEEAMIQQEFYCSFEAPNQGAYYGAQMMKADEEGRIGNVPHDPAVAVETWWDLGISDSTSIWFAQRVGQEIHLIDYYEATGEALSHYSRILQEKAQAGDWTYERTPIIAPHDVKARELGTGKTREEVLNGLGIKCAVVPQHHVSDGIEAVRNTLGRCWFDSEKCERGIEALRQYTKDWDDTRKMYKDKPRHDWASHSADAFRYGCMHKPSRGRDPNRQTYPELAIV